MRILFFLATLLALASYVRAGDWVVIVAGSNGYYNYRHQADACHAYQISKKWGVPENQIILMAYDDIASDPSNPFPGQVFNKPTDAGVPGVDVYAGCKISYSGNDVTAANFLAVLQGQASKVPAGKPVVQSTSQDNIFVYYTDHGAVGIVAMPVGPNLYATDLNVALQAMYDAKSYNKLVFYLEACESGSMFEGLLPANINIYTTTASNAEESSWGTYCSPDDMVNGVHLNSCLGDLYSVVWMENSDAAGQWEPIEIQTNITIVGTTLSHVMEYGTKAFVNYPIGDFQGNLDYIPSMRQSFAKRAVVPSNAAEKSAVDSRDINLHVKYTTYMYAVQNKASTQEIQKALNALQAELTVREYSDAFFNTFAASINSVNSLFATPKLPVSGTDCQKAVDAAIAQCGVWNDYSLKYHKVVVNACMNHGVTSSLVRVVAKVCGQLQL